MKYISKNHETSRKLDVFKDSITNPTKTEVTYSNTYDALCDDDFFKEVQESILAEQGYVCCYCMARISSTEELRVEHYKPKSVYKGISLEDLSKEKEGQKFINRLCEKNRDHETFEDLRIEYGNLLGACENKHNHCDVIKSNYELCEIPNPADRESFEAFLRLKGLRYTTRGKIFSANAAVKTDLESRLNLNAPNLVDRRKGAWKAVSKIISKRSKKKDWEKGGAAVQRIVEELIDRYSKPNKKGKYYEFSEYILYLLNKRFAHWV